MPNLKYKYLSTHISNFKNINIYIYIYIRFIIVKLYLHIYQHTFCSKCNII